MYEDVSGGSLLRTPAEAGDHTGRWRRRYTLVLAGAGVSGVLAGLLGLLLARSVSGAGSTTWWPVALVLVLPPVLVAVIGLGVWRWQSRSEPTRRLMRISTPASAREVGGALKAGRSLDPRQREIAQISVDAASRRRWQLWLSLVLAVAYGLLALYDDATSHWFSCVAGAGFLVSGMLQLRSRRTLLLRAARQGIWPAARIG